MPSPRLIRPERNTMKKLPLPLVFAIALLAGCGKNPLASASGSDFVTYLIAKGQQSASPAAYKYYNSLTEQRFIVRFDSSAIYRTVDPGNQADINKLYGFADDDKPHHASSARIGWRWFGGKLELHGYVYNDSLRTTALITDVPLKTDVNCSIKVSGNQYQFTVNGTALAMPRKAKTATGVGYRLYPFFGGTEMSPQDIRIQVREL
jgi:hypothetical protein